MRGRDVFFKPYRERINEMYQQHDSIDPGDRYEEVDKNRNYSPYFHNYRRSYSPSPERMSAHAYNPRYQNSPYSKENKPKTYYQVKLDKEFHEPIWQQLYAQGLQAQRNILEAHELEKNKIDLQCTFQPNIRKTSRYVIPASSNFLQRNEIWQQNRIDRIVKEKEQQVVKGLEDCTFRPRINSYYKLKSNKYSYKNFNKPKIHQSCVTVNPNRAIKTSKSAVKLNRASMELGDVRKQQQLIVPHVRDKQGINRQEVGKIKNLIRNELKRIEL